MHLSAGVANGVRRVDLAVRRVPGGQCGVVDQKQILRVLRLSSVRERERARDDRLAVNHHGVVVGDGVLTINPGWDSRMGQKIRRRVPGAGLLPDEDRLDPDPALMRLAEGLRDGGGRESVRLDENGLAGPAESLDDRLGRAPIRREVDGPRMRLLGLVGAQGVRVCTVRRQEREGQEQGAGMNGPPA